MLLPLLSLVTSLSILMSLEVFLFLLLCGLLVLVCSDCFSFAAALLSCHVMIHGDVQRTSRKKERSTEVGPVLRTIVAHSISLSFPMTSR